MTIKRVSTAVGSSASSNELTNDEINAALQKLGQ